MATNKLYEGMKISIQEGTAIYFRPDLNRRNGLINMEFRVVAAAAKAQSITSGSTSRNKMRLQEARVNAKHTMDFQEMQRKIAVSAVIDLTRPSVKVKEEPLDDEETPLVVATKVNSTISLFHTS